MLAEKWGQRPDQILDGMTSEEIAEAIAYYTLLDDEAEAARAQRDQRQRMQNAHDDVRAMTMGRGRVIGGN